MSMLMKITSSMKWTKLISSVYTRDILAIKNLPHLCGDHRPTATILPPSNAPYKQRIALYALFLLSDPWRKKTALQKNSALQKNAVLQKNTALQNNTALLHSRSEISDIKQWITSYHIILLISELGLPSRHKNCQIK